MIFAAILLSISQFLAVVVGCLLIRRIINGKQAEIELRVLTYISSLTNKGPNGEPSEFAKVLDMSGTVIGRAAARSILATMSSDKSHASQVANGVIDDAAAVTNPVLGLLSKRRRGRGAALEQIAELVGSYLFRQGGNNGSGSSPSGSQGTFNLQ